MDPGHPEYGLLGIVSLVILEGWQHTVNPVLNALLAFSGLSLVLGYGVLVLSLPLLLLPIAFPELSRPRDAVWSLVLAILAPLLLLNPLPVFSSAGFGELIATVLIGRLAAEVGQGRWESLTPDQRTALGHLPRWRRAGADLVTAVVQAAKAAWNATAQTTKATWAAVLDIKSPVEQPQAEKSAQESRQKPARKQWIRPESSDGAQVDQDGGTSSEVPDVAPEVVTSVVAANTTLDAESAQPVDGEDGDPDGAPADGAAAVVEGHAQTPEPAAQPSEGIIAAAVGHGPEAGEGGPEEPSSPEPVVLTEGAQPAQSVDGGDGDAIGAHGGSGDGAPAVVDPPEPAAQSSEGSVTAAAGRGPEAGEDGHEESSPPEPVVLAEGAQPPQSVGGGGDGDAIGAHGGSGDGAPAVVEGHAQTPEQPATQPSEGGGVTTAAGRGPEPGESGPEAPPPPEPIQLAEDAQPPEPLDDGGDNPGAREAHGSLQDAVNSPSVGVVALESSPGDKGWWGVVDSLDGVDRQL